MVPKRRRMWDGRVWPQPRRWHSSTRLKETLGLKPSKSTPSFHRAWACRKETSFVPSLPLSCVFEFTWDCDQVEIGLLHDLGIAQMVTTEPVTSDDWEIIVSITVTLLLRLFGTNADTGNPCIACRIHTPLPSSRCVDWPGD